ncbi:LTA synthase family protein [Chryseosolibacter indicus]|uniref:Sulfatase-like hydrolase/transferase n=1 Tax=Chryseosolibacter indicus TaxID=2782351 RepID=A0ABS5VTH3_9BACT|nr:alkaline phosphatase family protein [Chryseosolibacter indicus]MBT1704724.1 sulfatase-like hydrolase/transferase [Chryseosolibacter indicus]
MRARLRLFGFFAIFWVSYQIIIRAIFLLYNQAFTDDLTASEILQVFFHGFKMDLSICGYFLMLVGLLLSISVFAKGKVIGRILNITTILILLLSSIIVIVDLELYHHWGFRLNTTPLFYVGSEAMGSIGFSVYVKLILILIAIFTLSLFFYFKLIVPKFNALTQPAKKAFIPLFVLSAFMFIPIRGSFTVAPMNTGFVYFHKSKAYANHAAINVVWNFLYSIKKNSQIKYPENFFDQAKANDLFKDLYTESDSTVELLNIKKPNIIFFILESFTADVFEPLGGVKGVAPNLSKLCEEGILFDNFYASGDRTDKGLISILSAYPAQPQTSIIKFPSKTQRLPYVNHYIKKLGYNTSFIYGGDIDFANFRSYLTNCGFDYITRDEDFPDELNKSKWGIHDDIVLERAFSEVDTARAPFFKVILTLSSHEPFDVPVKHIKGSEPDSLFLNSCYFTDSTVGAFINKAKATTWWNNTIVVFVADHGHRQPGNKQMKDSRRFKIPFLIVGGAIKKDTVIHTLGSQTDIANTLLAQLDKPSKDFTFSKNLLSPTVKPFAAYFFNDGYGFLLPDKHIVYDNPGKQFLKKDNATESDLELSKAYQQVLYSDYNRK